MAANAAAAWEKDKWLLHRCLIFMALRSEPEPETESESEPKIPIQTGTKS